MAIKIEGSKRKTRIQRDPLFLDEKYTGTEPQWDADKAVNYTTAEFDNELRKSLSYYNYFYSIKDLKKYLVAWLNNNQGTLHDFTAQDIANYARTRDSATPFTACALVRAHSQGMPLLPRHLEYLRHAVSKAMQLGMASTEDETAADAKTPAKPTTVPMTIQQRMQELVVQHQTYFEELADSVMFGGKSIDPKAYEYLAAKNVPQAMLNKILQVFEQQQNELLSAQQGQCEQLTEAYAHVKAADHRRMQQFYGKLRDGFTQYQQLKRATKRAAVRRPPQKEKVVSKLKYLKTDGALKLVSINPVDIMGAQVLWVYNVKSRKIGKYVADSHAGTLGIKGTTIVGYDEVKSVQKTLRKPDVQLKEFMSASKVELRKWLDNIKSTDIRLSGRINQDTVLLKVA
jgi:hypothetical protein